MEVLTDEKLSGMAARRAASDDRMVLDAQLTALAQKGDVEAIERRIDEKKFAHNRKFPPGFSSDAERASSAEIANMAGSLRWAKESRALAENQARTMQFKADSAAGHSWRLFEVTAPDNRKIRQTAASLEDLRSRLQSGYTVSAEIFAGGYVKPIDGPSPAFDGWLEAHGPELLKWLGEQGVVIRRGNEAA